MMSTWKKRKLIKGLRASRTKSTPARIYFAIPPKDGWVGGREEENGYRRKGGK